MDSLTTINLNHNAIEAASKAAKEEITRYIELSGIENLLMTVFKSGFARGYIYSESKKKKKETVNEQEHKNDNR